MFVSSRGESRQGLQVTVRPALAALGFVSVTHTVATSVVIKESVCRSCHSDSPHAVSLNKGAVFPPTCSTLIASRLLCVWSEHTYLVIPIHTKHLLLRICGRKLKNSLGLLGTVGNLLIGVAPLLRHNK